MTILPSTRSGYLPLLFLFLLSTVLFAQDIAINEVMSSNSSAVADEDGDYSDWIELYNYGITEVDLTGYGLSDNEDSPFKWIFPAVTLNPGEFILIWASSKEKAVPGEPLHTSFKISAGGEEVLLTHSNGTLIDQMSPVPIPTDLSYGRLPDNMDEWVFYNEVTPDAANSATVHVLPPDPPVFSHSSGFYSDTFTLTLTHPDTEADIIYTLDGSEPLIENLSGVTYNYKNQYPQNPGQAVGPELTNSYTSNTYTAPLEVTDRSSQPNKLSNISSTYDFNSSYYFPDQPVKKATVVKARAVVDGNISPVITHTYFVSQAGAFNSTLPIISLSFNEDGFFDYDEGIYVAGADFDTWRAEYPNSSSHGGVPANWGRRGDETEQPAVFQFFHNNTLMLDQNIGVRLHGGWSRPFPNKSLRLYARSEYDTENTLDYSFFGSENSDSFKRLILRNSGNDFFTTYFRDAFIQEAVAHLRFETQDYQPAITYLNGEYWGMINIRERFDKHYMERVYDIDENDLSILELDGVIDEGDNSHYMMMRDFIASNDLAEETNYQYVNTLMDVDNFIDYQITEIYVGNEDWPANNIKYFRKNTQEYEPDAPYGHDGRWRWLLYDTDFGFGLYDSQGYTHNGLSLATETNGTDLPNPLWSTLFLRSLLENQEFKNNFINRYADLLNTAFLPDRLTGLIDGLAANIADEITSHWQRWGSPSGWDDKVQVMRNYAQERPGYAISHILDRFDISGTLGATLQVSDPDEGYIQINTIEITGSTLGVSVDPYPWTGTYFNNVPVTLKAISKPGYQFSHWSGAVNSTDEEIRITPTADFSVQANFMSEQISDSPVIYFWLMDNNIENDTPLESLDATFTATESPASLSFSSSSGADYPFTSDHPNWREGSMERRNEPTPINYRPTANTDIPYESVNMKALQIKQPFLNNGLENTLVFNIPTQDFENIHFSFAAMNEGAAEELIIDYYDIETDAWINTGLETPTHTLASEYQLYELDFTNVLTARNNPDFMIRIRFAGTNMEVNNGDRVTFNNIAVTGDPVGIESAEVTIDVSEEGKGYVQLVGINTQQKDITTFPWSDNFELNETITLTAVANEGSVFSHWSGASNSTDAEITFEVNTNGNYIAHFLPDGEEPSEDISFSVYPNPATSRMYIQADVSLFGSVYNIYDLYGKRILNGVLNDENTTIEVDHLRDGMYILRVGNNKDQTFKVIKY